MQLSVRDSPAGEGALEEGLPLPTSAANEPRPDERTLVDDLRAGEESAYAALFHEHFQALCDYATSYVKSRDDAREVVQQVFVSLFVDRARLRLDDQIGVYLYRAVHNRALNIVRSNRVRSRWTARLASVVMRGGVVSWNDGMSAVLQGELAARVRQLVDELPAKCKDAFLLVRVHGKSYQEAADILGVRKSTIQTHLVRATRILGRQLDELGLIDGAVRPGAGKRHNGADDAR